MQGLETENHAAGDKENPLPPWIRAHFVLELEFKELNEDQRELEAAIDRADNERMEVTPLQKLAVGCGADLQNTAGVSTCVCCLGAVE